MHAQGVYLHELHNALHMGSGLAVFARSCRALASLSAVILSSAILQDIFTGGQQNISAFFAQCPHCTGGHAICCWIQCPHTLAYPAPAGNMQPAPNPQDGS